MRFRTFGLLALLTAALAPAQVYQANPKLVVILVIDQFRGDYLERYRDDFKTASGFNLFLKRGAYFTDCYYNYANTETAPGHSSIATGAYANGHGIGTNSWWDLTRATDHQVSSVEDERYQIVGDHAATDLGTSPRNELASTLGDEVVLATQGRSKLFGISLKDRAAILTSGHASNGAYWVDKDTGHIVSSTYWGETLPAWVQAFNYSGRSDRATREADVVPGHWYEDVGGDPASISYLLDFAQALVTGEQLGHHATTDVLTISISSTDILGHKVGPDAPEQHAMIDALDVDLNAFFTWLDTHVEGGLANTWIALTGDHGIGPTLPAAAAARMPAAQFNMNKVTAAVDSALNARYSPGQSRKYLLGYTAPVMMLDTRTFASLKISEAEAEQAVADVLPKAFDDSAQPDPGGAIRLPVHGLLRHVYTRTQIEKSQLPPGPEGQLIANSYSANGGWYVLYEVGMYEQGSKTGVNHFTDYAYDRHVPLAFFGALFLPGTYHQQVEPIDLAPTLASLLRINRPSASVGHVLTFALKPETKN